MILGLLLTSLSPQELVDTRPDITCIVATQPVIIAQDVENTETRTTEEPTSPQDGKSDPNRDIVVAGSLRSGKIDPFAAVNIKSYAVTQSVDRAVIAPLASGYRRALPPPVRDGLHNVFTNLDEPVVFLNFLLQHKIGKAAETVGRFAINSTVGAAGLFDIAKRKRINLPHRPNGFADSLGFYGVRPGPFLFLPLIGPTTLRDVVGGGLDRLVLPVAIGIPFNKLSYSVPTGVLRALDRRVRFNGELEEQRAKDQPYISARQYYLRRRQNEIDWLKGRPGAIDPAFARPSEAAKPPGPMP